jgi:hypothetical protein
MNTYKRHRFPPGIVSYVVWVYYRFSLSYRDVDDLLAERGVIVSREAIRHWYLKHSLRSWGRLCIKFGKIYTRRLKKNHKGFGDTFFLDEVFVKINVNNISCGERLTKRAYPVRAASALGMVRLLTCIFNLSAMALLLSGFSSAY